MPRLSDSMEEGTVLAWMKSVGDEVALGDELVEIETDKANMVYESDAAGTLIEIVADEGETLPIGEVIARVGDAGEAPAAGCQRGGGGREPAAERRAAEQPPRRPPGERPPRARLRRPEPRAGSRAAGGGSRRASASRPRRSPAGSPRERGVDLAALTGSGPGGRIVKADVEAAAAGAAAPRRRPRRSGGADPGRRASGPRRPRAAPRRSS